MSLKHNCQDAENADAKYNVKKMFKKNALKIPDA
jgi:hypothetical protein